MDRKAVARETLEIMKQGYYLFPEKRPGAAEEHSLHQSEETDISSGQSSQVKRIVIAEDMRHSFCNSQLITPAQGKELLQKYEQEPPAVCSPWEVRKKTTVENLATVAAVRRLAQEGKTGIGVLNFASAKNPGGGFLNGAMAQEESLAASGTLYSVLIRHEAYYRENRAQRSMMYLDYAIYAPDVIFFRDEGFRLVENPVKASVLTLPAVNMGQVLIKGEDREEAEAVMRRRMKLALCIFAHQGAKHLVLGAYGCGVFRNDPKQVAAWWQDLLEEGMGSCFESVFHAVLDRSRNQSCIRAFEETAQEASSTLSGSVF